MHDALAAERLGIPAAAIITDRFVTTARAMAESSGMPGYPFAVIAHPISNNSDEVLRAKAEEAVRQCLTILITRPPADPELRAETD